MKNILLIMFILLMGSSVNIQAEDSHKKEDVSLENEVLAGSILEWSHIDLHNVMKIKHMKVIHSKGKAIIPFLIEHIDNEKEFFIDLMNPMSSTIKCYCHSKEYIGVFYAYLIELILAEEEIFRPYDYSKDIYTLDYYSGILYTCCRIAPLRVNPNPQKRSDDLTYLDMLKLKENYLKWWEKSKDKTLEELREDYKNMITPLAESDFFWF